MPQPANLTSSFDATWDAWNRLVKLQDGSDTVAEYGYDGLNRRIIKKIYDTGTLDETRHCYYSDQAQCLEERVDSSTDAAIAIRLGHPFRRRSYPARPGHQRRRHARRAALRALRPPLQRGGDHRRHRRRPGTLWLRRLRVDQHLQFFVRAPRQFQLRLGFPLHRPPAGPGIAALLLPRPLLPRPTRPLALPRSGRLRRWHVTLPRLLRAGRC